MTPILHRALVAAAAVSAITAQETPMFSLNGAFEDIGAEFGSSVHTIGDLDNDGVPDFAIGIRRALTTLGPQSGRIALFSGADRTEIDTIDGGFASLTGHALGCAGDVNGDGIPDIVVGAPSHDDGFETISGRVTVRSGADRSILLQITGIGRVGLGWDADGAGDVNADGFDDILAGAPFADANGAASGRVFVLSGRDGTQLYTFDGDSAGDLFGYSVAGVGDCNLDGFDDFAIGAIRDDHPSGGFDHGSVRVISGRDGSTLFTRYGALPGDRLGISLDRVGDVDRDGAVDILAGAHQDGTLGPRAGAAHVLSGLDGQSIHVLTRDSSVDEFGFSVAGVGDIDGDGFPDALVGAPRALDEDLEVGVAVLFSGDTGLPLQTWAGEVAGGQFGWSVGSAGDIDLDGYPEVLVGSLTESPNGTVRAFDLGATGTPPRSARIGRPCPGSPGRIPRAQLRGEPRVGESFRFGVRGAPLSEPNAILLIGEFPIEAPLDVLGLTGCELHFDPYISVPLGTNAEGMAGIDLNLPALTTPIGAQVFCQWFIQDLGAPYPLPLTLSDALELTIGG